MLEEVCRTIDNTLVPVLKMLVLSIEAHVQMPYIKRQTKVSMVHEKNVSSRRSRHVSFGSKVTEKERTQVDEL